VATARRAAKERIYKVAFLNEGKVYELYARGVSSSTLLGFIEVEGLLFGEKTKVVVDPSEERLRSEFAGVERTYVPIHSIVRIDQVEKRGAAKITAVSEGGDKVRSLPSPLFVPGKRES
jgi:hypothetical protein